MKRQASLARSLARLGHVAAAAVALGLLSGCATVEPWRRGTLAHRCMRVDIVAQREAARQHVLAVREGASGVDGGRGGGCGCD